MEREYEHRRTGSKNLHERALQCMPGGDTRSVTFFPPYPSFMVSGSGCRIKDVDGNEYLDFLNNYTSLVLGHAHPGVVNAVIERVKKGTVFPAPTEEQVLLAEKICDRVRSCEKIRFCNSGSEANIQAVRAAKKYTKRDVVVKVYGGYHGSFDFQNFIDIPFNDLEKAEVTIKNHKNEIACVITEPVLGKGMIPASEEFLCGLRELTSEYDILFILDEVVTFRLDRGGIQKIYKVNPDMTVLGKIIGGGFPVGAFGGIEEVMMQFSPQRKGFIPHSGSFNGNPVTMVAGLETLNILDAEAIARLNKMGDDLKERLNKTLKDVNVCVSGMGSLLYFHFGNPPSNAEEAERENKELFSRLHMHMLMDGIYIAPRGMFNLSVPMSEKEMQKFVSTTEEAASKVLS